MPGRQKLFIPERLVGVPGEPAKIKILTCALPPRQALLAHLLPECRGRAVGLLHQFRLREKFSCCLPSSEKAKDSEPCLITHELAEGRNS